MLNGLPKEPGEAAITVAEQGLAGELSLLLARLQQAAADHASGSAFEALRREAETAPVAALGSVAARALRLGDTVCPQTAGIPHRAPMLPLPDPGLVRKRRPGTSWRCRIPLVSQ